jgi:hypothetical protein
MRGTWLVLAASLLAASVAQLAAYPDYFVQNEAYECFDHPTRALGSHPGPVIDRCLSPSDTSKPLAAPTFDCSTRSQWNGLPNKGSIGAECEIHVPGRAVLSHGRWFGARTL